jgi:hypothetical protein
MIVQNRDIGYSSLSSDKLATGEFLIQHIDDYKGSQANFNHVVQPSPLGVECAWHGIGEWES